MKRDPATQRQVDAANPATSTWLSANAGSGKTRVLIDRVARLLLEGVSPQNILCLTYTKAAAAEMQNRLFRRLGEWAMMDESGLRAELQKLGAGQTTNQDQLRDARRLFARAIETPGGLKIQTIHSFCAGVLRRFPLEAGVSPQFREMEDRAAELLRADVVDDLLDGADAQVVHDVLAHFTGADFHKLTAEVAKKRDYFGVSDIQSMVRIELGLQPDAQRDDALAMAFQGDESDIAAQITDVFKDQSAMYKKFAASLSQLDLSQPNWPALDALFSLFLYASSSRSKSANYPQSNHAKAVEAMAPIADLVHDWMDRVAAAKEHLWAMDAVDRTEALYRFAEKFVPAYETRKLAMGSLDFDDLIRKAKALLTDRDVTQWVLFRLDGGIDHILVDEAQDTSPTQWAVIEQLTQEFATGEGANPDRERTVFVVGDKKQSIYSFQGADPSAFDKMKDHFQTAHKAAGKGFVVTSLDHSFRSSQAILSVVDATFQGDHAEGMTDHLSHISFKENMPGRVDLWPVIPKAEQEDERVWYHPIDEPSATDHHVLMAKRVASQIRHMIDNETIPEEIKQTGQFNRRAISEGDILILVQRRSELFAEIIQACKAANLNVAGADRLRVGAELAVKDLAALLRFLALPEDDLSLAEALKSPLLGWSEQDLFTLAHHRPEDGYLWSALRAGSYDETRAILDDLRKTSDFLRPYDLIERILIRHDGRKKLLARLGSEAEDGIDALLSQALAYESQGVPSLTGFLTWMETDDLEIKRQMDNQGDRIRVMTVHGAKGLEAPIVILPETTKRPVRQSDELLPAGDTVIWKTTSKKSAAEVEALRAEVMAKETQERMRLLYVAMTRAEKWLIVGASGDVGDDGDSWYNLVSEGMQQRGVHEATSGDLTINRVLGGDWDGGELAGRSARPTGAVEVPTFGQISEVVTPKTLSPSDLGGAKIMPGDPAGADSDDALRQGRFVHLLLEHLPLAPAAEREKLGHQLWLAGEAVVDDKPLVQQVIDLLDASQLADIWVPEALTEVDITADLPELGGRMHGAIDRLIVRSDQILAIDYKSNRLVPSKAGDTPVGLLRQMAAYWTGLRQIYPDRPIRLAILWTTDQTLMDIPEKLMVDALNSASAA